MARRPRVPGREGGGLLRVHSYYTGKQKIVDTAGRVEKFRRRYTKKAK